DIDKHYGGYIHLKTIPNASQSLIDEAGVWADRLSVNIELPTASDLNLLAPEKKRPQILGAMQGIRLKIDETNAEQKAGFKPPQFAPAGQSTQMIVGATKTSDIEILKTASELYSGQKLRRVYYSAYSPIPHADARLPGQSPPLVREHRLYQADWLIRFYGFDADEIVTQADQNLSLDIDPKLAWALGNRHFYPVDVNKASREELLRIPGIGSRNVERILKVRKYKALRTEDLKKLRVAWNRAKYFVLTVDHNSELANLERLDLRGKTQSKSTQLMLFDAAESAFTGEV
ncbi:MAG: biotin synthase, partial [Aureliella sp.]